MYFQYPKLVDNILGIFFSSSTMLNRGVPVPGSWLVLFLATTNVSFWIVSGNQFIIWYNMQLHN